MRKIVKFLIYCKDIEIGLLEVNEKGQHKYTPNEEGVARVKDEIHLIHEMLKKSDWRNPIPFFEERIENASRFSLDVISYHTDSFKMVKVSE